MSNVSTYTVELEDKVSDPAGKASSSARGLADSFSSLEAAAGKAAVGLAAMAAAGLAAAGAGLFEAGKFALEASERVNLMRASFEALAGGAPGAGQKTLDAVRAIAKEVPQSEKVVQDWARTLMGAGVTDLTSLRNSLKAVAGAEALVEGGGEKVKGILAKVAEQAAAGGGKVKFSLASLSGTGLTETEFLRALGMTPQNFAAAKKKGTLTGQAIGDAITKGLTEKSKDALNESMNTWDSAIAKGKDLISHLFEGVDTGPLMAAIRSFFDVFDLANPSGQAIKAGIGGAFNWLFGKAADGTLTLKHLFLETELGALKAYNFMRPLVHAFMTWMKVHDGWGKIVTVLKYVGIGLGLAAVAAAGVVAIVLTGGAAMTAFTVALIGGFGLAVVWIGKASAALADLIIKGYQGGKDFALGLLKGIEDGAGAVASAAKNMAKGAWDAVKNTLGIHSPSTVMVQAGKQTSEGFAKGVDAGGNRVQSATRAMAATPANGAGAQGAPSQTSHRNTFNIEIHAKDGATAHELLDLFEEQLASVYERLALSQGVAP